LIKLTTEPATVAGIWRNQILPSEGKIYHSPGVITRLQPKGGFRDEASKMKVRCKNGVKRKDGIRC
jgi:hypothetical protein